MSSDGSDVLKKLCSDFRGRMDGDTCRLRDVSVMAIYYGDNGTLRLSVEDGEGFMTEYIIPNVSMFSGDGEFYAFPHHVEMISLSVCRVTVISRGSRHSVYVGECRDG